MSKYAFRWAVAILVTVMLSLLSVIGKQTTPQAATPQMADWNRHIVADALMDRFTGLYNRTMRLCGIAPSTCEKARNQFPMTMSDIAQARRGGRNSDQLLIHYSNLMDNLDTALREVEVQLRK